MGLSWRTFPWIKGESGYSRLPKTGNVGRSPDILEKHHKTWPGSRHIHEENPRKLFSVGQNHSARFPCIPLQWARGCGTTEFHDFGAGSRPTSGCVGVEGGHQNSMVLERGSRSKRSPLFLGPVARGQLSRQLSRHCSLPGKSMGKDVPGKTWEWGQEESQGCEFQQ